MSEPDKVRERYARRREIEAAWDGHAPHNYLPMQEKERAIMRWINSCAIAPLRDRRLLDVGCGSGGDLLGFIRVGFDPANLVGWELLEHRAEAARHQLPASVRIDCGDALEIPAEEQSFDVVMQSTVFTSLLDAAFQQQLADRMWSLVKPGGGVLWFDFVYDNPRNRDVRGVSKRRVAELFGAGDMRCWRLQLAPPIARRAVRIYPPLYTALNSLVFLRTHIMCWIRKPG
jgi:SAM-dependent methyltransferase